MIRHDRYQLQSPSRQRSQAPQQFCCWTGLKHSGSPKGRVEFFGLMLPNHLRVRHPNHTRNSSCYSRISWDLNTSITSRRKTISLRGVRLAWLIGADPVQQIYIYIYPGFIVLGPDFFFGSYILDLPADLDKLPWIDDARDVAAEIFPVWQDTVKAT